MAVRKKPWWVYPPGGPVRWDMRADAVAVLSMEYLMQIYSDLDLHEPASRSSHGGPEKSVIIRAALVRWCRDRGFDPVAQIKSYEATGIWPDVTQILTK